MIRWSIEPSVVCWTTNVEYRVVDASGSVLATCTSRDDAERAAMQLLAFVADRVLGEPWDDEEKTKR